MESTASAPAAAETSAPAAPASEAPTTESAITHAVKSGNMREFRQAKRAERAGRPLADVQIETKTPAVAAPADAAVSTAPAAPAQPVEKVSNRQQEINDKIRKAADAATAQLREENARLKQQLESRQAPPETKPAPAQSTEPAKTWQDAVKRPDISKPMLSETQFFEQYPDAPYGAFGSYLTKYLDAQDRDADRTRAEQTSFETFHKEHSERFGSAIRAAAQADPTFKDRLNPALAQAKPLHAFIRNEAGQVLDRATGKPVQTTMANLIADVAYYADHPDLVLLHFSEHPEDADAIGKLPEALWRDRINQIAGRLTKPVAPSPKTLTDLSEPVETLGTRAAAPADPVMAAVKKGNFREFRQAKKAKRLAESH